MLEAASRLQVQDVAYRVPGHGPLIEGITFAAQSDEIIAIAGPNGAGKTTLIRVLAGLLRPAAGSVLLHGKDLHAMTAAQRAQHIAYVSQSDAIDGRLSVAQYVALGSMPRRAAMNEKARIAELEEALDAVGLADFAERHMEKLSGGERQKAKIARAICQRPEVLILDEPTNHLDPHARGQLLGLVAQMGVTIIAALHDLTLIDAFAHKTLLIEGGKQRAFATPDEVLTDERVRDVFQIGLHRFPHPTEARMLPATDIQISART